MKSGFAIHIYTANESMHDSCLANADGDLLIVPQQGEGTAGTAGSAAGQG
jgi:homogentisate 1,2-dioxygenase